MAAVASVGFFTTLGVIGVRHALTQPAATVAPLQAVAADPVTPAPASIAVMPLQPGAAEPGVSDLEPDGRDSADSIPAPTYDQVTAVRDRAAAHSARSH